MPYSPELVRTTVLPVLRELVRTYQAFHEGAAVNIEQFGLTVEQFDVIATLGNTQGMNILQLQGKTLLVKTTLNRVLAELEAEKLVVKEQQAGKPVAIFRLTSIGDKIFQISFEIHMHYLQERFSCLEKSELDFLQYILKHLGHSFVESLPQ
jgi:MarR family transcriptional regulator, 2-MHQ and catechol-resistance regulon repressor